MLKTHQLCGLGGSGVGEAELIEIMIDYLKRTGSAFWEDVKVAR